jgi:isopenicillin-N epimerase
MHELARDPALTHLNHASFGAPTRTLLDLAERHRRALEQDTANALGPALDQGLTGARGAVADLLGATADRLALTANATSATAAAVTSLVRAGARRFVTTDLEYASSIRALQVAAADAGGAVLVVPVPVPLTTSADLVALLDGAVTEHGWSDGFDYLLHSHTTSSTALVLPAQELAAWAGARGARVVLDAAHLAGHHHPARMEELGAAVVVGTLHKWLPAPRPAGFVWADEQHVPLLRPAEVSLSYDEPSLQGRFGWRGTYDPANLLVLPAAVDTWSRWEADGLHHRATELSARIAAELAALGHRPTGPPDRVPPRLRAHLVDDVDADALQARLTAQGVRAWVGTSAMGRTILRHALHGLSTDDDADRFVAAVRVSAPGR